MGLNCTTRTAFYNKFAHAGWNKAHCHDAGYNKNLKVLHTHCVAYVFNDGYTTREKSSSI